MLWPPQAFKRRIGAANCFNPLFPDRFYELNLRQPDELMVTRLLVRLSDEVGENWVDETRNHIVYLEKAESVVPQAISISVVKKAMKGIEQTKVHLAQFETKPQSERKVDRK